MNLKVIFGRLAWGLMPSHDPNHRDEYGLNRLSCESAPENPYSGSCAPADGYLWSCYRVPFVLYAGS